MEHIKEDILIIGGGPIGGLLAHVFATKHNFSVRVIERLPDLTDPTIDYEDRSGIISASYRASNIFYKYGLQKEYRKILNPFDHMTFLVDNIEMNLPFIPGKKVHFHPLARRCLNEMFNTINKENPRIQYEYNTQVENIDFEQHILTTQNLQTKETLQRKFQFIIAADGYRSKVRTSMEQHMISKDSSIKPTHIEENLFSTQNFYVPDYAGYLKMQEEVKQGKYPFYDKLDDKYKQGHRKLCGKYIMDPSSMHVYGEQNLLGMIGPMNDGTTLLIIGLPRTKTTIQEFLYQNPQFKNNWRIDPKFNFSFEDLQTEEQAHEFFAKHFPIVYGLTPNLIEQWKSNKIFKNYTVFCDNWYYKGEACLFGDACEGITFISGNGMNAALENLDYFFEFLEKQTNGDSQKFLSDAELRENIFKAYQNRCFQYTRAMQISDKTDAVFPGLPQAQHPKAMLFNALEAILFEKAEGIYNNKINFSFFTLDSFEDLIKKVDLFKEYIIKKLQQAEKIEDLDVENCRQELIDILQKHNLPIQYTIAPEALIN